MVLKKCSVPGCGKTSEKNPETLFIMFPQNDNRKKWFNAINVPLRMSPATYCCEDHFDLEKDMENFIQYKLMKCRVRMKDTAIPHKMLHQEPELNLKANTEPQLGPLSSAQVAKRNFYKLVDPPFVRLPMESRNDKVENNVTVNIEKEMETFYSSDSSNYHISVVDEQDALGITIDEKESLEIKIEPLDNSYNLNNDYYDIKNGNEDFAPFLKTEEADIKKETGENNNTIAVQVKFECLYCDYITSTQENLKIHLESMHWDGKNHKCHLCDYSSNTKCSLELHLESDHSEVKKFKCDLCDHLTNRKSSLISHMECVHLKLRKHKCNLCDFATNHKNHLRNHIKDVHLQVWEHKCQFCDYSTNMRTCLQSHVNSIHLNLKKYACSLCDYSANHKVSLSVHIDKVHLNTPRFQCDSCDYKTFTKFALNSHIQRIHLKVKKFKCKLCDFAAGQKITLKNHMNSFHSKDKQYKCDICKYATNQKDVLDVHFDNNHLIKMDREKVEEKIENGNMISDQKCFVPNCGNTSVGNPEKSFILLPANNVVRKRWFEAVKVPFKTTRKIYCCEDHFDLEEDMEDFKLFKLMKCKVRMKETVVPHKFLHRRAHYQDSEKE